MMKRITIVKSFIVLVLGFHGHYCTAFFKLWTKGPSYKHITAVNYSHNEISYGLCYIELPLCVQSSIIFYDCKLLA